MEYIELLLEQEALEWLLFDFLDLPYKCYPEVAFRVHLVGIVNLDPKQSCIVRVQVQFKTEYSI